MIHVRRRDVDVLSHKGKTTAICGKKVALINTARGSYVRLGYSQSSKVCPTCRELAMRGGD